MTEADPNRLLPGDVLAPAAVSAAPGSQPTLLVISQCDSELITLGVSRGVPRVFKYMLCDPPGPNDWRALDVLTVTELRLIRLIRVTA